MGRHFTFQQRLQGLPVENALVAVHYDGEGRVIAHNNGYRAGLSLDSVEPAVPLERALELAAESSGDGPAGRSLRAGLPVARAALVVAAADGAQQHEVRRARAHVGPGGQELAGRPLRDVGAGTGEDAEDAGVRRMRAEPRGVCRLGLGRLGPAGSGQDEDDESGIEGSGHQAPPRGRRRGRRHGPFQAESVREDLIILALARVA
jgi:hypothetical protein